MSGIRTDLSKYDNSWYRPGSILKRVLWHFCGRIFINTYFPFPSGLKLALLRLFGAKTGSHVTIKPKVNIKYPWFLEIGNHCWIGEWVWIDNLTTVKLGDHVCLSQGAMLLTGNHDYKKSSFDLIVKPITLENGTWIGAKATVCPGVTCRSHSVLTAGSVATKDLEPYSVYRGVPASIAGLREIHS